MTQIVKQTISIKRKCTNEGFILKINHHKSKTTGRSVRLSNGNSDKWVLRLYVAGKTIKAATALNNIKLICEEQLKDKYHIEVIDILKYPKLAGMYQILAIPTLVRKLPLPVRNIIGDLSNTERVLDWLDVKSYNAIKYK